MQRKLLILFISLLPGFGLQAGTTVDYVANAGEIVKAADWDKMITVTVDFDEFSYEPAELVFEVGQPYKLVLKNHGEKKHYFTAEEFYKAIATRKVKWDRRYQEKYGITTEAAHDLPPAVVAQLDRMSRRIYRALGLSGYARMDFRVNAAGQCYVLEANANPNVASAEDFAQSALSAGMGYDELLARIIKLGCDYKAEWRADYG